MHHISSETGFIKGGDGQADAIDGDAVSQTDVLQYFLTLNTEYRGSCDFIDGAYGADFFYHSCEHGNTSLSIRMSSPIAVNFGLTS